MKKNLLISYCLIGLFLNSSAQEFQSSIPAANPASSQSVTASYQTSQPLAGNLSWSVQPFDHKVFIENKGQFDKLGNVNDKILYGAQLGDNLFAYFTTKGIVYRTVTYPNIEEAESAARGKMKSGDPDRETKPPVIKYLNSHWVGSNANVTADAQEVQTDYYTYPVGKASLVVKISKKVTYHDLYPGIDAEFTFPKNKNGFEYALIIHPGADLSKVKLQYTNAKGMHINKAGDIVIQSEVGEVIDHAPVSFYKGGSNVSSGYDLNGNAETFRMNSEYDKTKTLVIDPWTWTSSPALATNKAYDLDYDAQGNVYVYGSSGTWQLAKFNNVGVKLWTYNATPISTGYFGAFACDRLGGKCFCVEGFNSSGMDAVEVSTGGIQLASNRCAANLQEGWRARWNICTNQIIVAGGSWFTTCDAGCLLDTNDNITPVNVLSENNVEEGHDMALECIDPNGNTCYMATTKSAGDPNNFDNVIIKLPIPALTPTAYYAPTGFAFQEANVAQYCGAGISNGLNGMCASPNWLYIYDGAKLKRVNKVTGAIITTMVITATPEQWGGLDVDNCDNIYVGENSGIQLYNAALALQTTYPTSNTIYDLRLGKNFLMLYASGNGFVSQMSLPQICLISSCGIVLPVELKNFSCNAIPDGIGLSWTTATETNNKYFTVERSSDGVTYNTIAIVQGAGNSSVQKEYQYLDADPLAGENYYRLTQTDFDGNSVSVGNSVCSMEISRLEVFPNPSAGRFTVELPSAYVITASTLSLYDMLGRQVYSTNTQGQQTLNLDVHQFTPGVYMLKVTTPDKSFVQKIVISK